MHELATIYINQFTEPYFPQFITLHMQPKQSNFYQYKGNHLKHFAIESYICACMS